METILKEKINKLNLFLVLGILLSSEIFGGQFKNQSMKKTATGIEYRIIKKSKGEKVKNEFRLYINYITKLNEDTAVFDSNKGLGKPYAFIVGQEEGLLGWDESLLLLKVGDSAHFIIPAQLAYGPRKIGKIPANSTVHFYVKVLSQEQAYYDTKSIDSVVLAQGVQKYLIKEGSKVKVNNFELLTMAFTGYILNSDGKKRIFQSSLTNSNKAIFQLGSGRMIPGLDLGIATMKVGEKATFKISPDMAFGAIKNGIIPENSTLFYDVEVLSSKYPFLIPNNTDTITDKYGIKILKCNTTQEEPILIDKVVTFHCLNYFLDSLGHRIILNSTHESNQPLIVRCGSKVGSIGLNKGLFNLRKGEQATIMVPPSLGFGRMQKGIVPANSVLYYDVEILDVRTYPFFNTSLSDTLETVKGLKYISVKSNGNAAAKENDEVGVAYTGFILDSLGNKVIFDASRENGRLLDFTLGKKNVIEGFDLGIQGMSVGDARRLIIPYQLAYGEKGVPEAGIPAKCPLYFDVELIRIKFKKEENNNQKTN